MKFCNISRIFTYTSMALKGLNLYLLFICATKTASQRCGGSSSQYGFVLEGHVFESFTTGCVGDCYSACNTNPACQSLNFNLKGNTCEFNAETHRSRPKSFKEQESSVYAENPNRAKKGSQDTVPGQSCKDIRDSENISTSGTYWIRPAESDDSFQGYCDMSAIDEWKKTDKSWIQETEKIGVTLEYSEVNDGLVITGQVTSYGCGQGTPISAGLTLIKGYWTKIKYKQVFYGVAGCWSIFGAQRYGGLEDGVYSLDITQGDLISDVFNMGGDTHAFDGRTTRCDNELDTNFWRNPNPKREASVVLRRILTAEKAGIFTGTSCGTPNYNISDIYVKF